MISLKVDLVLAVCLNLIVRTYSQYDCEVLLPEANVYCVSPTHFSVEPPSCNTTIFSCPDGFLCADINTICNGEVSAACILSRACYKCPPNAFSTCVNSRQYVACLNGKPDIIVKNCQASRPYCSMEYNSDGNIVVSCTPIIQNIACRGDCDPEPTTTEPPPTETSPPPVTNPPPNAAQCYAPSACRSITTIMSSHFNLYFSNSPSLRHVSNRKQYSAKFSIEHFSLPSKLKTISSSRCSCGSCQHQRRQHFHYQYRIHQFPLT